MMGYILRRTTYYVSLQAGIVICTFVLFYTIPSDPARIILGPNAPPQQVAALRTQLGLDQPLPTQLVAYFKRVLQLEFGRSFVDGRPIAPEVMQKLQVSLTLICLTLVFTLVYVAAVAAAEFLLNSRLGDYLDFVWVSTPTMFSGVILSLLAAYFYPFKFFSGQLSSLHDFLFFLPPAFALALYPMAVLSRILRGELRRLQQARFIVAARAVGFPEWRIFSTYMLRNALIPFLATLSGQIPLLFTGAFVVEVIFSIPGIGSLLLKAVLNRDFPMLQALVILNGFIVLSVHLVFELLYPLVDPRLISGGN